MGSIGANFFIALARVVDIALTLYYWIILIRALISWVNPDPFNPIVQFLHRATEPVLGAIRRILPPMGIDISPIIAILGVVFLKGFLVQTLWQIGYSLR